MCTTERLASMLTKGPLTIYRWKSWTRMSDNHPPPKIRGRSKHFRVILFCNHHVQRVQLTARFRRAVLVTKRGKNLHTELQINATLGESQCFTQDEKHLHPRVENQKEAYIVALWERFGTTTLHFSIAPKKDISMREATELNLQDFEDNSKTLDGSLATSVAEGKLFVQDQNTSHSEKDCGNSEVQSIPSFRTCIRQKSTCSPTHCSVWERTRCAK